MRLKIGVMTVLLLILSGWPFAAPGVGAQAPRTPDDDNSMANSTALTSGVPVSDSIDSSDDPYDYYSITVLSGQTFKVVVTYYNSSAKVNFSINDSEDNPLVFVCTGGMSRGYTILSITNSTYYIVVTAMNCTCDYTITVTVSYPPIIKPGDPAGGTLSSDGDNRAEFYRFWLAGNVSGSTDVAVLDITQTNTSATLGAGMTDILHCASGQMFNESWKLTRRGTLRAAAAQTGWYYCEVYAITGISGYSMAYSRSQMAPLDGDNDYANATPAILNGNMTGEVSKAFDHYDWYSYQLPPSDNLELTVARTLRNDAWAVLVFNSSLGYVTGAEGDAYVVLNLIASPVMATYYVAIGMLTAYRASPYWAYTDDESSMTYNISARTNNHSPGYYAPFENKTMNEDEKLRLKMGDHFRDPDGDALAYSLDQDRRPHFCSTYENGSDELELTPVPDWAGMEMVYIRAYDGEFSVDAPINLTVLQVEDPPINNLSIPNVTMAQNGTDTSLNLSWHFCDYDIPYGDVLSYGVEGNGSIMVDIAPGGNVTLKGAINFWGRMNMTFTATDRASNMARCPCNVTVNHMNQAPQVKASPPDITVTEDDSVTMDLSPVFWDPDGDPITLTASDNFQIKVAQLNGTLNVTFDPAPDASDFYENIRLTARDDKGLGSNWAIVRVTVTPVNDPPRINSFSPQGDVEIKEDQSQLFSVSATDPEGSILLSYAWSLDGLEVLVGVTEYLLRTNLSSAGVHNVTVSVSDGELATAKSWKVVVQNVNRDPAGVDISSPKPGETVRDGTPVLLTGEAQDPDGDPLTFTWFEGTKELGKGRAISVVLPAGTHTIFLQVSDGTTTIRSKAQILTVKVNSAPQMQSLAPSSGQSFTKGTRIAFKASFSDPDNDTLSYCWTEGGKVLSTSASFDRSDLLAGKHTISLTVSDGNLTTVTTLTVVVVDKGKGGFIPGMGAGPLVLAVAIALLVVRGRRFSGAGPDRDSSDPRAV